MFAKHTDCFTETRAPLRGLHRHVFKAWRFARINSLATLRDMLLPKLLGGELRLAELQN